MSPGVPIVPAAETRKALHRRGAGFFRGLRRRAFLGAAGNCLRKPNMCGFPVTAEALAEKPGLETHGGRGSRGFGKAAASWRSEPPAARCRCSPKRGFRVKSRQTSDRFGEQRDFAALAAFLFYAGFPHLFRCRAEEAGNHRLRFLDCGAAGSRRTAYFSHRRRSGSSGRNCQCFSIRAEKRPIRKPLIRAHRTVPSLTPSKCHMPKKQKERMMPSRQLAIS